MPSHRTDLPRTAASIPPSSSTTSRRPPPFFSSPSSDFYPLLAERIDAPSLPFFALVSLETCAAVKERLKRIAVLRYSPFFVANPLSPVQVRFDVTAMSPLLDRRSLERACVAVREGALPALASLWMAVNDVGEEGGRLLSTALPSLPRLTAVRLGWCGLGDGGAKALFSPFPLPGAPPSFPSLLSLNVQGNSIGDEGFVALVRAAECGSFRQVTRLDFRKNSVSNEGCKALSGMRTGALPQLQNLSLSYNRVEDEGANAVHDAMLKRRVLVQLRECDFRDNPSSVGLLQRRSYFFP